MCQKSIRIQLVISESGQPEVFRYLEAFPKRWRTDRVRFLSELGLLCLNGKRLVSDTGTADAPSVPAPEAPAPAERKTSPAKKKALSRLSAGFQDGETAASGKREQAP